MRKLWLIAVLLSVLFLPVLAADFSGDGTGDISIFRPLTGLWAIRGYTRTYFGQGNDIAVPGDYEGSGLASVGVFRPSSGLWAIRGFTRAYFGRDRDEAKPGDYTGDGTFDIAIFRKSTGLWAVRGVTRVYFGSADDMAIEAGGVRGPVRTLDDSTTAQIAGYYEAFDLATVDPNLDAGNIKSAVTVFGIEGNVLEASGNAGAAQVLEGFTFSRAGEVGVTGTMSDRGSPTWAPGLSDQNLDAGYYGGGTVSGDADLVTGNIRSGVTIFGVAGDPDVVNTSSGDAAAGDIKSGKKAWVDGAEVTGTIATQTLFADNPTVAEGFYAATTLSAVDTDLTVENIRAGVTIFGVEGTPAVVNTSSGDAEAGDILTGKKAWVNGIQVVGVMPPGQTLQTGQTFSYQSDDDGHYQNGVAFSYQTLDPADNGEIVTIDNVTGLMWASNGNEVGCYNGNIRTWEQAIIWAENLIFAGFNDWRMPNIRELMSLINIGRYNPAIDTQFFPATKWDFYWSSSTNSDDTTQAWGINFVYGYPGCRDKTGGRFVRAVRNQD